MVASVSARIVWKRATKEKHKHYVESWVNNMFCFECGANIPDNSKFCTKCGTSMKIESDVSTEVPGTITIPDAAHIPTAKIQADNAPPQPAHTPPPGTPVNVEPSQPQYMPRNAQPYGAPTQQPLYAQPANVPLYSARPQAMT